MTATKIPAVTGAKSGVNGAEIPAQLTRSTGIDAYRGLVMFLMMAEMLHLSGLAAAYPDNGWLQFLGYHQSHVAWVGCSLHDMIQPSFSFLVGVSLPFSLASRLQRGHSLSALWAHAALRSLILIFLGIFLRSIGHGQTRFTFEDTLTQIGLGYLFLFGLGLTSQRVQWIAVITILVGYWLAFASYPRPGADFDWSQAGVRADWEHHLTGFAAHWNMNTNLAWAVDRWFLNLFPRAEPFVFNGGGYSTLSFIPTLGTMVLGLLAGGWLQNPSWTPSRKFRTLLLAAGGCLAVGWLLGALGICPVVKKIWTPSWTLFSGGWCFLALAIFYQLFDVIKLSPLWVFPLLVIGANSIAAYCMDWLFVGFLRNTLEVHLGSEPFEGPVGHFWQGTLVLLILWSILYWMYRRRVFIKI